MDQSIMTMQLTGRVSILEHVYGEKAVISSNYCKLDNSIICQTLGQDTIQFIKHDICNLLQI